MSDAVEPTFDTPENAEVLQEDEQPLEAIPVRIDGVVRTEEMPSRTADFRNIILKAGSRAEKILNDDSRRKRVVLWQVITIDSEAVQICIAATEFEANAFRGAIINSGANAVARYEFTYSGELWARPCVINDTAGIINPTYAATTDDTILNVVAEQWAH